MLVNVSITLCYPLCVGFRVICFHRYSSFPLLGAGSRYSAIILFTSRTCNDKRRKAKVLSLISMAAHAILHHAARPLRMSGMQEAPHNFQGRHKCTTSSISKTTRRGRWIRTISKRSVTDATTASTTAWASIFRNENRSRKRFRNAGEKPPG